MANEFIIKRGFESKGNSQVTGSLSVSANILANGSIVGSNLSGTNTGDQDLSALALKTAISGAFVAPSASFSTRVTANDAKLTANTTNVSNAGALMDSEVTDIATIKSLTKAGISGSFVASSASFSTRTTTLESNPVFSSTMISGSFIAPSSSFSTRVTFLEEGGAVGFTSSGISGSLGPNATLIRSLTATGISGSSTELSASFSTRVSSLETKSVFSGSLLGNGSAINSINASNISSGTIAAARVATLNQNTTGNAATATTLATARNINGVSFDGSADITTVEGNTGGTGDTLTAITIGTTEFTVATGTGNGNVETSGTPLDNDYAKFTSGYQIEGRSTSEVKTDLSLNNVENTALSTYTGNGGALDNQYIANGRGFALKTAISGAFVASSASFSTRVTGNALGMSTNASNISSNTSNITSNRSLITGITSSLDTVGRMVFVGSNGTLTSEAGFAYNATTNQLSVDSLNVTHLTSSFITSSNIKTSGSNIFGDSTSDTQTFIGTTFISGAAQITGSLRVSANIKSVGTVIGSNLSGTNTGDQDLSTLALKTAISGSFIAPSSSFSTRVTLNDAKLTANTTNVTSAGALMDSELAEIATVKSLTKAGISGSFGSPSSSFSTRVTFLEEGGAVGFTSSGISGSLGPNAVLIRSLTAAKISGSFGAPSASFSTRVTLNDAKLTANTSNVTSAGALMDSELTNLAAVKAINQSLVSGATPAFTTTNFTDASNKRLMTDAQETKLDSVETDADVTDTANVTSAGALMNSELAEIATVKLLTKSGISGSFTELSASLADRAKFTSIWDVQSPSGGQYEFKGPGLIGSENKPALYLTRGEQYRFSINNASGHPFYIQTSAGAYNSGNVYNDGVTGNGTQSGNLDFNVQFDAPTTLYYVCSNHSGMGNIIYIDDFIPDTASTASYVAGANVDGAVATATLAADATTLATPRNINGVAFDGSQAITVTAAGSTLSDTVTVAKGGTGATSLTATRVLIGNGTSALATDSGFTYSSNVLTTEGLTITSTSAQNSEATALMINGSNVVGTRELGSNAFNSTAIPTAAMISGSFTELSASLSNRAKFTSIWDVVSPSGGQYEFKGPGLTGTENKPALYLTRGEQYQFNINASGHPFYIQTSAGAYNSGNVYNDGVTGNGTQVGDLDFNVQFDAPTKLYYVCSAHSGMGNIIYIDDFIPETAATASYVAGANVDGAVATATLAADATTLATPRAINGVNFDGSAPITITAAGSTLSDTVTVAKGGTGATSLTANRVLIGNGTSAVTTDSGFTYSSNILGVEGLLISSVSAQNSEATSLMINGDGAVGTRELGSNAFNSTTIPTAAMISGSFTATSASFSTRIAANEIITAKTLISGSSQIKLSDYSMGTGLDTTGGGTGLALDLSEFTDMTGAINTAQDELILLDNGAERRKLFSEIFGSNAYNSTTIGTNTNALTVDNTTVQLNSGTTFNGSAARTLSAKTATIANGGTALATADQIHTFVTGFGYSTLALGTTSTTALAGNTTVGTVVAANPGSGIYDTLERITIGGTSFNIPAGTGNGTVDTSGTPVDNDFAKFTDANTIEGRSAAETKTDLSLNNVENTAISTFAGSTNITTVGTIGTGTWNGTAIADAYLSSNTAHLSGTQTFSGAKTFSSLSSFTMDGNTITGIDDSGEFTDDDAHIMTSAGVNDRITSFGYSTTTGTLTGNGSTNRVPIYNGTTSFTTDSGFTYSSNILSTEKLNITAIAATTSENTTIMIDGDGQTLTRELGSNAFNSTTIPTNAVLTSGTQTIAGAKTFSDTLTVTATGGIDVDTAGHASLTVDRASTSYDNNLLFRTNGDTKFRLWQDGDADYLYIRDDDNATNMVTFVKGGNVGIGTTAPTAGLQVKIGSVATPADYAAFLANDTARFNSNHSNEYGIGIGYVNATTDTFGMQSGTTSAVKPLSLNPFGGNVGIGTTSPSSTLHVSEGKLTISGTGCGLEMPDTAGNPTLKLVTDQNAFTGCNIINGWGNSLNTGVGIGTTRSDGIAMQVRTGVSLSSGFATDSGTTAFIVKGDGNVGIGATSPSHSLEVQSDTAIASINGPTTNGKPMLFIGEQNAYGVGFRWNSGLGLDIMDFDNVTPTSTSGTKIGHFEIRNEEFYWKGNVGIGTDSPSQKLTVAGTIMSTAASNPTLILQDSTHSDITIKGDSGIFSVSNQSVGENITMLYNGNVGIGTTAPTEKLQLASGGNIKLAGSGGIFVEHSTASVGGQVIFPNGGMYRTNSNAHTGMIKIALPGGAAPADMLSFWVDVFDYTVNESFSVFIGGYAYQTAGQNEWVNQTAMVLSTNHHKNYTVRFGHDSSNHCVLIGETNSTWNYIQVTVRDVQIGYTADIDAYNDGWVVSFVTSSPTVDETESNNFPFAQGLASTANIPVYFGSTEEFRFETDGDFHADGDVVAQSTSVSDSRLKDNIIPIGQALDKIKSLRGVSYTWNSGKKKGKQDIGLIAQEVEKVIPEIVKDKKMPLMEGADPEETYKTIDYEKIIAVLVEAVKDQQTQIDDLKKQIKK